MGERIALSGVPETMLQTVYARARETQTAGRSAFSSSASTVYARARETQTRGTLRDDKAVELVNRLDYDFSRAEADKAMRSG